MRRQIRGCAIFPFTFAVCRRYWTLGDTVLESCRSTDALAATLCTRASSHASWSIDVFLLERHVAAAGGTFGDFEHCAAALATAARKVPLRELELTFCPTSLSSRVLLCSLAAVRPSLDALCLRSGAADDLTSAVMEPLEVLLAPSLRRFTLDLSNSSFSSSSSMSASGPSSFSGGSCASLPLRGVLERCSALECLSLCGEKSFAPLLAQTKLPPRLVTLDVRSGGVDDAMAVALATALAQCADFAVLQLRHNRVGRDGAAAIASACRKLRALSLHTNPLGDDGLRAVLRHVPQWAELRLLNFTRCRITSRALPDLARALAQAPRLETLVLDRNDLRPIRSCAASHAARDEEANEDGAGLFAYGANYMSPRGDAKVPTSYEIERRDAESGRRRYTGLEKSEKKSENPEESGEPLGFRLLGEALSSCRALQTLSLADCALCDLSLAAFAARLAAPRLSSLRLSANPLFARECGVAALVSLLRGAAESVRALDISCTAIDSAGVALLADGPDGDVSRAALRRLRAIAELRLSFCRIGPDGFEALADALPSAAALQRILMDGNGTLGDKAASDLLAALVQMPAVAFVSLSGSVPVSAVTSPECAALRRRGVVVHI